VTRPEPYASTGAAAPGTDLGRAGFVVAIVVVALSVLQQGAFSFIPLIQANTGVSLGVISAGIGVFAVVHGALSAVAFVLGLLGARRGRSMVLSGIAIGVGGAGVVVGIIGIFIVPVIGFLL
jgi:hypothetical protein